jgi:hypothetical protein
VSERPLKRDAVVDEPGLVGARWWQESVVDPLGRRQLLTALTVVIGAGAAVGIAGLAGQDCNPTRTSRLGALDLQRQYGWSFGAAFESLVFNGTTTEPFSASRLGSLVDDLAPRVPAHRPFYVQTLLESVNPGFTSVLEGDPAPILPLKGILRPIYTSGMRSAFEWAQANVAALVAVPGGALVVDLDGPDSVAFAAGAIQRFDPVFLFDNWPHPRGVVPAHLTLAAATYYQPLFAKALLSAPRDVPPAFVLDRQRLATYTDDAMQFDNRWVARMPGVQALQSLGVRRLVYIVPAGQTGELDDLNDDLVTDHAAGIAIRVIQVGAPASTGLGVDYVPVARRTAFSSGIAGGGRPTPANFGSVPVAVSLVGGTLLGVAWSRSGTWNRGWGG